MATHRLVQQAIISANRMYGYLEDLHEILEELTYDENIDLNIREALDEANHLLNDVELLDEIIARLGCIELYDGDEE